MGNIQLDLGIWDSRFLKLGHLNIKFWDLKTWDFQLWDLKL